MRALGQREGKDPSQLGVDAGLSRDTVGKWVRNGRPGKVAELAKLAKRYRLSMDWLSSTEALPSDYELSTDPQLSIAELAELLGTEDWSTAGASMRDLPDSLRKAALGVTCVYGYPLESTSRIAAELLEASDSTASLTTPDWFGKIRDAILSRGRPPSGTHPALSRTPPNKTGT